jgi:hypothetical protein
VSLAGPKAASYRLHHNYSWYQRLSLQPLLDTDLIQPLIENPEEQDKEPMKDVAFWNRGSRFGIYKEALPSVQFLAPCAQIPVEEHCRGVFMPWS